MGYLEILKDIIQILSVDYSGIKEKQGILKFDQISKELKTLMMEQAFTDFDFYLYVNKLLLLFTDQHLFFNLLENNKVQLFTCGFKVRKHEKCLIITEIYDEGCKLTKGLRIIAIDGFSIEQMEKGEKNSVEQDYWHYHVLASKKLIVENANREQIEYETKLFHRKPSEKPYKFTQVEENIGMLTITDFFEPAKMETFLNTFEAAISHCSGLIIDVRDNPGGTDASFYRVLEYCFDKDVVLSEIDNEQIEFNMTERNYSLRIAKLKSSLNNADSPELKEYFNRFIQQMDKYRNKGFVSFNFYNCEHDKIIKGISSIKEVIILIDSNCASSAETFVNLALNSKKVKTIGRPTAGALDYCNLAEQRYSDRFSFKYPTSRSKNIDLGKGISRIGIRPDLHIPWEVSMLERDVDLEIAINDLKARLTL